MHKAHPSIYTRGIYTWLWLYVRYAPLAHLDCTFLKCRTMASFDLSQSSRSRDHLEYSKPMIDISLIQILSNHPKWHSCDTQRECYWACFFIFLELESVLNRLAKKTKQVVKLKQDCQSSVLHPNFWAKEKKGGEGVLSDACKSSGTNCDLKRSQANWNVFIGNKNTYTWLTFSTSCLDILSVTNTRNRATVVSKINTMPDFRDLVHFLFWSSKIFLGQFSSYDDPQPVELMRFQFQALEFNCKTQGNIINSSSFIMFIIVLKILSI